jgi:hypothetical protein
MNRYWMFLISTLPPRMHQKLTKHGRVCKQNNQLPTRNHVELKDNSITFLLFHIDRSFDHTTCLRDQYLTSVWLIQQSPTNKLYYKIDTHG